MDTYKNSPKLSNLIILGIIISIVITFSGVVYYKKEKKITRTEKFNELKAIADLKSKQIEQWHKERLSEVVFFANNYSTVKDVESLIKADNSKRISLYKSLSHMLSDKRYQNIFILSPDNDILFTIDSTFQEVDSKAKALSAKSITEKSIVFSDFYYCEIHNKLLLDFVSPIKNKDDSIIATIFFRVNPNDYLFPIIELWPTPSKTAETLIVEQDNDSVVFINKLRHINNVPLKFKVPLSSNEIPAVKAVQGFVGFFEGVDYRGTKVLSIISKIQDTNWYMIAKVDKDEIYSDLYSKATYIVVISIITFLLLNITIFWIYHLKQRNLFKQLFTAEIDLHQSKEELRATLYSIGDGVITTDIEGKIKRMNPVAVELTGWTESEAIGKTLSTVFNIVDEENRETLIDPTFKVLKEGITVELGRNTILISRNGSQIPIADSAAPIYDRESNIIGVVIVFRNQSSEREAQKSFKALHEKIFSIIYTSPLSIIVTNLKGEVTLWNHAAEKTFGWNENEVLNKPNPIIPPDKFDEVKLIRQRVENGEVIKNVETTRITKQGNRIDVSFSVSLLKDNNDKPFEILGIVTDITERKRFENELKENEIQYHNLADSGLALIWTSDKNKLCNYFNEPWLKFTGRSLDQELGNGWAEGVHPDEIDMCFETFVNAFDKREPFEMEYRLMHNSGEYRWIRDMGTPNFNRNGEFVGYIGHCFDITEQKKTEQALTESKSKLYAALNSMTDAVFISDNGGNFIDFNDAFATFHRFKTKEECSKTFMDYPDFFEVYLPDGQLASIEQWAVPRAISGETATNVEYNLRRKDTGETWVGSYSFAPIRNDKGYITGSVVTARDITEHKRTEEILRENKSRLELAMQSVNMAWWEMDITTGNVIFDKRKSEMLGYPSEKFSHYTDFMALVHPEDTDKTMQAMQRHIDGVADKYEIEYRILTISGEYKWFFDIGTIVKKDSDGKPLNVTGLVFDITERKRIDQKIREKDQEFRKLSANVPDLIFQFTRKTDGTYCVPIASEGIRNIFGCMPEDVINDFTPIGRVIHPDDAERVIRDIEYSAEHLTYFTCEFRVQIPGKQTQWIYSKSTPERLPDGSITWYGFNTDITHRKLAEEALKKSEERFRSTLDNMIEGCQIIDFDWKYLYINKAAEKQNRRNNQELLNNIYTEMWPEVESTRVYTLMKDCMINRQSHGFENEFTFPNGASGWFYLSIQPIPEGIFILSEDITEKKNAEKEIKLKDTLLHLTGEMAKVGGWEFDVETMTGTWTDEVARIHDLDTSIQTSVELGISFYQKESRKKIKEALKNAIENAEPYDLELEIISAKGVHKWVRSMGIPLVENNKTHKVRGIFQDITEQKKATEQLLQSELRFRTLVESAPEAIFIQINGQFAFLNPAAQRLFKAQTEDQLIGKPVLDSFHPDYRETVKQRIHELNVNRKPVPCIEEKCLTINGEAFDVEVSAVPFSYNNIDGALVFLHNITDRKIAENEIRKLNEELEQKVKNRTIELNNALEFVEHIMDNTTVGISVYNNKGNCILANEAMAQIVGTTKENVLLQNYHQIKSWKEAGLIEKAKTAIKEMNTQKIEFHNTTSFGKDVWIDCKFTPFKTFEQTNLLLTVTDITERMMRQKEISELNEELQSNIEKLENVNKELEAFSYSVSHDLRGPLRAIHGFIQILHEDYYQKIDSEADRLMSIVQENTLRMGQLIDNLLAFSRISRTEIKKSTINTNSIVKSIIDEFTYLEKNCKTEFKVDSLPNYQGDPTLFHQVWANLLSNAVKYSSKVEKPLVEIGFSEDKHFYEFYVKDNGAGFEMQYADKLFKVFQRLHNNREFEGTGVGLAIIQRIVSRHGGDVRAIGEVDKGATFYFTVPK